MFIRMRWFTLGAVASLGVVAYAANQVRKARDRLTPENLIRQAGRGVSALLDAAAHRIAPDQERR